MSKDQEGKPALVRQVSDDSQVSATRSNAVQPGEQTATVSSTHSGGRYLASDFDEEDPRAPMFRGSAQKRSGVPIIASDLSAALRGRSLLGTMSFMPSSTEKPKSMQTSIASASTGGKNTSAVSSDTTKVPKAWDQPDTQDQMCGEQSADAAKEEKETVGSNPADSQARQAGSFVVDTDDDESFRGGGSA